MAAFSYHYHPFLLDPAFIPNTPYNQQSHINTSLPPSYEISCVHQDSEVNFSDIDPCSVTINNHSPQSSMVVDKLENGEHVTQKVTPFEKKRRNRNGSLFSCSPSKDSREGRSKKQKKRNDEVKEEDKPKEEKKIEKEGPEQPPKGYIHVRARRGQATDSHSLAERVRREKISEKMNMLQKLVPGCDNVIGKALVLDEIINYVQSLQNQVEFLSMKIASVNPMFFDLAMDLDTPMKLNCIASPTPLLPSVPQCSLNHSTHLASTMATTNNTGFNAADDYLLFPYSDKNTIFQYSGGDELWNMEDQREFLKPYGFNNESSSLN